MRVSVLKGDDGYVENAFFYEVFLDGKKLHDCYAADSDKGLAIVSERHSDGELVLRVDRSGFKMKTVYGKIEIIHHKDLV